MSVKLEGMPTNLATADTFTGKKVIDREGIEYGKVKHIHINQDTLAVSGVTIHQGFRRDYFLSEDYIDKFSEETLLLSRPPVRIGIPVTESDFDDSLEHFDAEEAIQIDEFANEEAIQMTSASGPDLFLPLIIITAILGGLTIFYLVKYFKK